MGSEGTLLEFHFSVKGWPCRERGREETGKVTHLWAPPPPTASPSSEQGVRGWAASSEGGPEQLRDTGLQAVPPVRAPRRALGPPSPQRGLTLVPRWGVAGSLGTNIRDTNYRVTREETDKQNSPEPVKKIEFLTKNLPAKIPRGPKALHVLSIRP